MEGTARPPVLLFGVAGPEPRLLDSGPEGVLRKFSDEVAIVLVSLLGEAPERFERARWRSRLHRERGAAYALDDALRAFERSAARHAGPEAEAARVRVLQAYREAQTKLGVPA